jgi:hypothetical protein
MARVSSYVTSTDIENTKKMTELLREHARKYYDIKKDFGIVMSMKESFIRDNFDFSEVNHEIIQRNTHQYVLSGCLTKLKRTLRREQRLRIFNEKFNGNCQFIINGYMNHLRMNTDAVAWSEILSIYDVQFLPEKTRDTAAANLHRMFQKPARPLRLLHGKDKVDPVDTHLDLFCLPIHWGEHVEQGICRATGRQVPAKSIVI